MILYVLLQLEGKEGNPIYRVLGKKGENRKIETLTNRLNQLLCLGSNLTNYISPNNVLTNF